ncbi:hypothetical protein CRENBAI_004438, partial [Crenichthys baileyi]
MGLADEHQASSMDIFTVLSREAEKTLRRSAGLSVPQSAYDGSRLAISFPWTSPLRRRSPPAPLAAHSGPAVKFSPSSRRKKRRCGAPSCVSAGKESLSAAAVMPGAGTPLLADVRAAASKPASLPATAPSPRLAAPPPMPSSLAPARCSEATPDELEERLRFFARQIKTFRKTSLLYSSPDLIERIRQMEEDYGTASSPRQDSRELLLLLQSSPRQDSRELLLLLQSSPRQDSRALLLLLLLQSSPRPRPEHLLSFLWGVLTELKPDTPQPVSARPDTSHPDTARSDTPHPDSGPDPKSASTSSTRRRGRRKRDASVHATGGLCDASAPGLITEGLCDASAPAHTTEGQGDASAPAHPAEGLGHASAPAHATEGLGGASAPAHATDGLGHASALAHVTEGPADASAPSLQRFSGKLVLFLASEPCDEGLEEEEPPDPVLGEFKEQFVLVLASEPLDEGFEDEALSDPVPEGFKEQFVLVLASEARDEGSPGAAWASEGSPGAAWASEGSPGAAWASEGSP